MNPALAQLANELQLAAPGRERLRFAFGLACVERVGHLLEEPRAVTGLATLRAYAAGRADATALRDAAAEMQRVASQHHGSNSIDGSAHAAVSATYAVANALAGRALDAASYAAYATVYAYGGYAVNDPASFEPEFSWKMERLRALGAGHA